MSRRRSAEKRDTLPDAKYGDQVPPDVEPIMVSWMPQAFTM